MCCYRPMYPRRDYFATVLHKLFPARAARCGDTDTIGAVTGSTMPVIVAPPPESSLLLRSPQVQHKCDMFTTGACGRLASARCSKTPRPRLVTKQNSSSSCSPNFRHASRMLPPEACHAHEAIAVAGGFAIHAADVSSLYRRKAVLGA